MGRRLRQPGRPVPRRRGLPRRRAPERRHRAAATTRGPSSSAYDFDGSQLTKRWTFDSDVAGEPVPRAGQPQPVGGRRRRRPEGRDRLRLHDDRRRRHGALHAPASATGTRCTSATSTRPVPASRCSRCTRRRRTARASVRRSATPPPARCSGRCRPPPTPVAAASGDIDPPHPGAESLGGRRRRRVELAGRASCGRRRASCCRHDDPRGELPHLVGRRPPAGDHRPRLGHGRRSRASRRSPSGTRKTRVRDEIYRATGTLSDNGTKGTPALQADLFGDWREEIVTRLADSSALRIATTVDLTDHRLRTLQSDPVYRLGVAWQNTGYNQPPHTRLLPGRRHDDAGRAEHRLHGRRHRPGRARARSGHRQARRRACCPATTGTTTAATRSP